MPRKAPARRHAGISRPVRQERDRKVGHPDQGQRGDCGLTASSIESLAWPAYPSSISPLISWEKPMPPSVTVARAGKVSLPLSRPSARAWRTAFSISRWAVTPNALRNFRMLALKTSSFMATSFTPVPAGTTLLSSACPVVYHLDRHHQPLPAWPLAGGRFPLLALRSRPTIQIVASACRRCRRCPRRTEFVSRRDLRYLLRQARFGHNLANALDEGCGAERFLPQDHLNSRIQPCMILDRKVARSDDNDRDLVPDRMLLHLCYELKSVHLRHHQIKNDDVRNAFPELVEGDTPILGLDQQPCLGSQPGANALSLDCVILDDQDPGWSGRRSIFRNQIHQLLAVDRLREIPNGPQRHAMPPLVYDRRHDGRNICKLRVAA